MKIVGSTPYSSLMIGDSFEADILGALKLGMQALHLIRTMNLNIIDVQLYIL